MESLKDSVKEFYEILFRGYLNARAYRKRQRQERRAARREHKFMLRNYRSDSRRYKKYSVLNSLISIKAVLADKELKEKFLNTFLQSATYYILAFLTVYIFYQVTTIIVARSFGIPVVWFYNRLQFPLPSESILYSRNAMMAIFGSGPLVSLIVGLVCLQRFFSGVENGKNFNLIYLWGCVHGLNMVFGSYIVGFFTRTEFIYFSEWLRMNNPFDYFESLMVFTFISIMIVAGSLMTPM
ncbi:MAG: hypothetical protein WCL00_10325, partial [Bacteroidota bacterium]